MDDYDMKLIFRQSPDAGEMPYAIEELTYLVQAIAQREDAHGALTDLSLIATTASRKTCANRSFSPWLAAIQAKKI